MITVNKKILVSLVCGLVGVVACNSGGSGSGGGGPALASGTYTMNVSNVTDAPGAFGCKKELSNGALSSSNTFNVTSNGNNLLTNSVQLTNSPYNTFTMNGTQNTCLSQHNTVSGTNENNQPITVNLSTTWSNCSLSSTGVLSANISVTETENGNNGSLCSGSFTLTPGSDSSNAPVNVQVNKNNGSTQFIQSAINKLNNK